MIMNKIFKVGALSVAVMMSCAAGAQTFKGAWTPADAIKTLTVDENTLQKKQAVQGVVSGTDKKAVAVSKKSIIKRDATGKPGALYTANEGYYNLVPGVGLAQSEDGSTIYAENGIFGYIDRDLKFINKTPADEYDSFVWDFLGTIYEGDTLVMHPYFATNGYYFETPKLTATYAGADSTYQMGTYVNSAGETVPGMVATSGMAYVYNVDVHALPFVNTYYNTINSSDIWNNMLFGWDTESKPYYVESYTAPSGGPIGIWGAHFYLVTPKATEFKESNSFTVEWWELSDDGKSWNTVKEFTNVVPSYEGLTNGMRLWSVSVNSTKPDVMIKNEYCIVVKGPHDGTQWALFAQIDRDPSEDAKNTAYFIPTVGDLEGEFCQYTLVGLDDNGNESPFTYNTSLDIWQFIVSPYIIMVDESNNFISETDYDFSINGETRNYLMMDWWGTADGGVELTATVSNSTDGDWLTVTAPVAGTGTSASLFSMSMTAEAKKFNQKARRATVTISDNVGFSRDIIVYQGDREEADNELAINEAESIGQAVVTAEADGYKVIYPSCYNTLSVYATSGCLMTVQQLPEGGVANINAAAWSKGVYMMTLSGNGKTQTVKVVR